MEDTDYDEVPYPPPIKIKKRGITYGKKSRAEVARSLSASAVAVAVAGERGRKRERESEEDGSGSISGNGEGGEEDADSESAGEATSKIPKPKRARKSTSLTDAAASAKAPAVATLPKIPHLSLTRPCPVSSSLSSSKPTASKSKRTSSARSSHRQRSKPPRAPSAPSSPQKPSAAERQRQNLLMVGGGASSQSESEVRGKRSRTAGPARDPEAGGPASSAKAPAAMEVDVEPTSAALPGFDLTSTTIQIPDSAKDDVTLTSAPAPSPFPVPDTPVVTVAQAVAPCKSILGNKSTNIPSHLFPPSIHEVFTRSRSVTVVVADVASPRRHSSLNGVGTGQGSRRSSVTASPRIQVFRDPEPFTSTLRGEEIRRTQSTSTAPRSRSSSAQPVAPTRRSSVPPSSTNQIQATELMNLQGLSSALPDTTSLPPAALPTAHSFPLLLPREPLPSPSSVPIPDFQPLAPSAHDLPTTSAHDLDLDPEELQAVYRPPMPREGSAIPHHEMHSSFVLESFDGFDFDEDHPMGVMEVDEGEMVVGGGVGGSGERKMDVAPPTEEDEEKVDADDDAEPRWASEVREGKRPSRYETLRIPPRLAPAPVDRPRRSGPSAKEDDLAYFIRTTATGEDVSSDTSSSDDEAFYKSAEEEIGRGVGPGLWIRNREGGAKGKGGRRSRFLRQVLEEPREVEEGVSEDELLLSGSWSKAEVGAEEVGEK